MTSQATGARKSQFALFKSRKFTPLFITMFLGAFNDNFFKSALVILITYRLAEPAGVDARILVTLAAGVFILPFVTFSALASQLADKYERSGLVRKTKLAEFLIMACAAAGFFFESINGLIVVLFLMGTQSAFFGPLKYSILPQHLDVDELIGANALIETGTFISILFGTIFGGLFVLRGGGVLLVSLLVMGIAAAGWFSSLFIPRTRVIDPLLKFRLNIFKETYSLVRGVWPKRDIFLSVIGISWFYFVGGTFLSQFATYAKTVIGADEQVATLFLAVFSVGIGAGSLACNELLKGQVSGRYVPLAALGMAILSVSLFFVSSRPPLSSDAALISAGEFLRSPLNAAVLACLLGISFFGGLYIVPLYAIIQTRSDEDSLARVMACANVMDSLFMVVSSLATTAMLGAGFSIPQIFLTIAALTVVAAWVVRDAVSEQMGKG